MKIRFNKEFTGEKPEVLTFQIRNGGNWNYKNNLPAICTKPLGIVKGGDLFEIVFAHKDLFDLLDLYFDCDELSVAMINSKHIDTGAVESYETKFLDKVQAWINNKRG